MAKRDASKALGGMSGKAASALRGRRAALDAAIDGPSGGKAKKVTIREGKSGKKAYK